MAPEVLSQENCNADFFRKNNIKMFQLDNGKDTLYGSYHRLEVEGQEDVFIYLSSLANTPTTKVFSREFQDYLGGLPKERWETYDQVAEKLNKDFERAKTHDGKFRVSYL